MDAGATVGFFGKLPCRGDFLRRRVRDDFVSVWDEWLQQCIAQSQRELEAPWLDAYLASPMWRFVLSEGVCGTGAYAGVLMPSVDRVGRYFPMTIVAQWNASASAIDVACGARSWFEAIETLAAEALETSDLDGFDAKVAQAAALVNVDGIEESAWLRDAFGRADFPHRFSQWHAPLGSVNSLQRAVNAFAMREIDRTLRPLSLWWSDGSDGVAASWLCARGLPAPKSFSAMLCGRWDGPDWHSVAPGGGRFVDTSAQDSAGVVRITPSHEPLTREWGAPPTATHFVSRPEIGLWGVVASSGDGAGAAMCAGAGTDVTVAQAIADALQEVEDSGSLTVVAERVRSALEAVQGHFARRSGAETPTWASSIGTMVFVARGADCALIFAGPAQAVRCHGAQAVVVVGIAEDWDDDDFMSSREPRSSAVADTVVELIDLVTGRLAPSVEPHVAIDVRYEPLSEGQRWLIAGAPLFNEADLNRVAAAVATDDVGMTKSLEAVRAVCTYTAGGPLPVLLLGVAQE